VAPASTDTRPVSSRPDRGWLSLGPAARLLGVDPDTLRRWADDGRVEAYTTPGGHRRFARRALERLATTRGGAARPLASLGATPERLSRAYRRSYEAHHPGRPATALLAGKDRDAYRRDGQRLVEALVAHLDTDPSDVAARTRTEGRAAELVDDLAGRLALGGTSLTDSVGQFIAARRPFLAEIAAIGRRRALDPARLATLYEDASGLLDRLLLRLIATHQAHDA
jgi:excisionase family DNA binding protein